MKILSLNAQNFLTIGDNSPILRLDNRGLLLIAGDNRDDPSAKSNGAGKSSVPDALCWVLNGTTARGVSGDAVVNHVAKKNCMVMAVLLDGDIVYKIERYRKHSTNKNQAFVYMWPTLTAFNTGNPGTPMHKGTEKETQEVIQGILGCSPEVFMASIYAGQEKMPDLPGMTDKELKTLIEQAAGVERLEKAYTVAKDRLLQATNALGQVDASIEREQSGKALIESRIADAAQNIAEFEAGRSLRSAAFNNKALEIKNQAVKIAEALKNFKEPELNNRLEALMVSIDAGRKSSEQKDKLSDKMNLARQLVAVAEATFNSCAGAVKRETDSFTKASEKIGTPCRECGKPHTKEDMGAYLNAAALRKADAEKDLALAKEKLDQRKADADKARSEHDEYLKNMPDISQIMTEVTNIQKTIQASKEAKNRVALLMKDIEANLNQAKQVMSEPNPHEHVVVAYKSQIEAHDSSLAALHAKRAVLEAEHVLAQNVASIFSPSGVRAHVLDTITPFLNDRTARYLSAMSDGNITAVWSTLTTTAKGELREKFNIEVQNATGGKSFDVLSGGEKRKVRLATMLALQDLVSTRATKPIELWIGDEIDHALDAPGLERLMGILEEKARERGTVLIISHNELGDWVDQVVTVVKKGGQSVLEGALA